MPQHFHNLTDEALIMPTGTVTFFDDFQRGDALIFVSEKYHSVQVRWVGQNWGQGGGGWRQHWSGIERGVRLCSVANGCLLLQLVKSGRRRTLVTELWLPDHDYDYDAVREAAIPHESS